jgi:hypothetical protein
MVGMELQGKPGRERRKIRLVVRGDVYWEVKGRNEVGISYLDV